MGYDLSRYEAGARAAAPAVADSQQGESARLAAADDPDAVADGDADEESTEGGAGRRRSRRGGARGGPVRDRLTGPVFDGVPAPAQ